jgi:hypothetical protein
MKELDYKVICDKPVYDYAQLMAQKPCVIDTIESDSFGIDLVEHPFCGTLRALIAVDHDNKLAFSTGFYDPWNDTALDVIYQKHVAILEAQTMGTCNEKH